jgi:hypothetical protein
MLWMRLASSTYVLRESLPDVIWLGPTASARRLASRRTGQIPTHVSAPNQTAPNVRVQSLAVRNGERPKR